MYKIEMRNKKKPFWGFEKCYLFLFSFLEKKTRQREVQSMITPKPKAIYQFVIFILLFYANKALLQKVKM